MKKLTPRETEVTGDEARIRWLAAEVLAEVGVEKDSGGWETLYRDPADGRYWLKRFPQGERQGGGAPVLKYILLTDQEIKERFVPPDQWKAETERFYRERGIKFNPPQ